jgi:hypothetical protein
MPRVGLVQRGIIVLSRDLGSRCTISAVALTLCVVGWLVFASGPASAAVGHDYLTQIPGFESPTALAFDAAGDVYVVDSGAKTVDRFSSSGTPPVFSPLAFSASGEYIVGAKLTGTPTGTGGTLVSFEHPDGVAVNEASTGPGAGDVYVADGAGHVLDVFSSTGQYVSRLTGTPTGAGGAEVPFKDPQGLAVDQSTHDLYVTDPESEVVDVFSSTGSYVTQFGAGVLGVSGPYGESVAVNDLTEEAYVGDSGTDTVDVFGSSGSLLPPEWHGAGTPDGLFEGGYVYVGLDPTTHHVYVASTAFSAVDEFGAFASEKYLGQLTGTPSRGFTRPQAVAVDPTNQDLYVADFDEETGSGVVDVFGPDVIVPTVSIKPITAIGQNSATLSGDVNPMGGETTYRFEDSTNGAQWSSLGNASIAGNAGEVPVTQNVTAFAGDTTYHVRLVAVNLVGTATSTEETFTTLPAGPPKPPAPAGCPNEQVRSESDVNPETGVPFSLALPECRAYEMVSPPLKNGSPMTNQVSQFIASASLVSSLGSEGSALLVNSTGIWQGGEQPANNALLNSDASEAETYRLTRGESGWGFRPAVPSALDLRLYGSFIPPYSNDINLNGVFLGAGFAPSEQFLRLENLTNLDPNLYRLEPDGAVAEIGPSAPPSERPATEQARKEDAASGVVPRGASIDLSRTLFSVDGIRWPFDHTKTSTPTFGYYINSLYEYVGTGHTGEGTDVPTLVGVDNEEAQISECGTGARVKALPDESDGASSISGGGSTVFFTALAEGQGCSAGEGGGPLVDQLFARVGEPGAGTKVGNAVTVNVAGTECATSDSCNVTKAVEYQGASADGSKVFFTSEQPSLIAGETDTTNSLYECRLPGDSGASMTRMAAVKVNPCPDLVPVSGSGAGAGADVQSVVAVSEDGSHVYFTAKGVLTGENAEHKTPAPGQDNLYVWQEPITSHPLGHTAFIVTLPSAKFAPGGEQATPNGDSLVFTSAADLTPGDTSTVSQVFLYEAQHEALVRVSKGQNGFNNDGNTTTDPASIFNGAVVKGRRVISEDGSTVVFESSQALTAQAHGGIDNVYLWRGGNVYLISDGTTADESVQRPIGGQYAGLVGIDASGQNVFFTTETHLVGQDSDELSDLYDARIGGGFPAPKVNACSGEACQGGPPTSLAPVSPGSLSPSGVGNVTPPPAPPAKPTVEILKTKVKATTLLVTVRTSAKGRVQISGKGLTTTIKEGLKAGTHQIKVKLTKAGRKAGAHRKKTRLRVSLTVGKQTVAKTTSVKL